MYKVHYRKKGTAVIGPIADSVGIIAGSTLGALLGTRLPDNFVKRLPMVFGCISMGMGITMLFDIANLPAVIIATMFGTIIGELIRFEEGVRNLAGKIQLFAGKNLPVRKTDISAHQYMKEFTTMIVLFGASGTGIFGALREGMEGDPTLLIVKAFLDFGTATLFAATLGISLAIAAVPQFIIQSLLFLTATLIMPLTTADMLSDFSAVGGLIMLATGFNICNIATFPIISMLPSLILIMPVSMLWDKII